MSSQIQNFDDLAEDGTMYFKHFTGRFLTRVLADRWNYLIERDSSKWKKIDLWKLWERGSCRNPITEWTGDLDSLIKYMGEKNSKDPIAISLGHSEPYIKKIQLVELKEQILHMLEGLVIFKEADIVLAINHDGEFLVFE